MYIFFWRERDGRRGAVCSGSNFLPWVVRWFLLFFNIHVPSSTLGRGAMNLPNSPGSDWGKINNKNGSMVLIGQSDGGIKCNRAISCESLGKSAESSSLALSLVFMCLCFILSPVTFVMSMSMRDNINRTHIFRACLNPSHNLFPDVFWLLRSKVGVFFRVAPFLSPWQERSTPPPPSRL